MPSRSPKTKTVENLSALELHALRIAAKTADKWRDTLDVGKGQPVDFLVRVRGEVDVASNDPTATTSEKPDLERCLALLLARLGPKTRRQAAADLVKDYADPLVVDPQGEAVKMAKSVVETLTVRERKEKRGNVSGRITLTRRAL